jgi:hypothetical protein
VRENTTADGFKEMLAGGVEAANRPEELFALTMVLTVLVLAIPDHFADGLAYTSEAYRALLRLLGGHLHFVLHRSNSGVSSRAAEQV